LTNSVLQRPDLTGIYLPHKMSTVFHLT